MCHCVIVSFQPFPNLFWGVMGIWSLQNLLQCVYFIFSMFNIFVLNGKPLESSDLYPFM